MQRNQCSGRKEIINDPHSRSKIRPHLCAFRSRSTPPCRIRKGTSSPYQAILIFTIQEKRVLKNIEGKGEHDGIQNTLPHPRCPLPPHEKISSVELDMQCNLSSAKCLNLDKSKMIWCSKEFRVDYLNTSIPSFQTAHSCISFLPSTRYNHVCILYK